MGQLKRHWWLLVGIPCAALASAGCGWFAPPPPGGAPAVPVESRTAITDPKLKAVVEGWHDWVLQQKPAPAGPPLFSRAEILPVTVTTLPYGVGAYQQQPRLPVILTTGPGWSALKSEQKEEQTARAYRELEDRLRKAGLALECRPTLTLQTPQGLLLAWVNEVSDVRKLIHGDTD
jgi:hypothetical protein